MQERAKTAAVAAAAAAAQQTCKFSVDSSQISSDPSSRMASIAASSQVHFYRVLGRENRGVSQLSDLKTKVLRIEADS